DAPVSRLAFLQRRFDLTAVERGSFSGVLDEFETRSHGLGAGWITAGRDHESGQRDGPKEHPSGAARRRSVSGRVTRYRCTSHTRWFQRSVKPTRRAILFRGISSAGWICRSAQLVLLFGAGGFPSSTNWSLPPGMSPCVSRVPSGQRISSWSILAALP